MVFKTELSRLPWLLVEQGRRSFSVAVILVAELGLSCFMQSAGSKSS